MRQPNLVKLLTLSVPRPTPIQPQQCTGKLMGEWCQETLMLLISHLMGAGLLSPTYQSISNQMIKPRQYPVSLKMQHWVKLRLRLTLLPYYVSKANIKYLHHQNDGNINIIDNSVWQNFILRNSLISLRPTLEKKYF